MTAIKQALKEHFGFDQFHPGQLETIQSILAGHDTLTVLPTGSGKSLIYQLSGYLLPGTVLIISPLISLMQDQVARMQYQGERSVVALTSMQTVKEQRLALRRLPQTKFIFASPEIIQRADIQSAIDHCHISLLVIDEAHCISTWGPDFRPDYLELKQLHYRLSTVPVLMLTATATPQVRQDIFDRLAITDATQLIYSVNRTNIFLAVQKVASPEQKRQTLLSLVSTIKGPGIVYFSSKKVANQVSDWLNQVSQLRVATYHAGINSHARFQIQQQFMDDQLDVICATSAFGMGIDKADVRYVIHYHPTTNLENYVQEIGRAGRDGQQAIAIILSGPGDQELMRLLNQQNLPDEQSLTADYHRYNNQQPAIDDTQRVLDYYWRHQQSVSQVVRLFNKRAQAKEQELQVMQDYIDTTGCHRRIIDEYFGESAIPHTETCCAAGVSELPIEQLGLKREADVAPVSSNLHDWQHQLATMFLPNS